MQVLKAASLKKHNLQQRRLTLSLSCSTHCPKSASFAQPISARLLRGRPRLRWEASAYGVFWLGAIARNATQENNKSRT